MVEKFVPIPGYEHYKVGDFGTIIGRGNRPLSPYVMDSGYKRVKLCMGGKFKWHFVHRIVLMAFVGPQPDRMYAAHLNGDPGDNRLENLMWKTMSDNHMDKHTHGTILVKEKHPRAAVTQKDVYEMRSRYAGPQTRGKRTGPTLAELASEYGITKSQVRRIVTGEQWT